MTLLHHSVKNQKSDDQTNSAQRQPHFPKPDTHTDSTQRQDFRSEVMNTSLPQGGNKVRGCEEENRRKKSKQDRQATHQICSISCHCPFSSTTETATKDTTSGCITEDRRHGRPEEPTESRAHALTMPLPRCFGGKRLCTSVRPVASGQGPRLQVLGKCLKILGSFVLRKEIDPRATPPLHLHVHNRQIPS